MKKQIKGFRAISATLSLAVLLTAGVAHAAASPTLGLASTFGILSSTFTNTAGGTTINGDLGYTTGPAVAPTVNGTTYSPPSATYTQAGIDQGSALTALNNQGCTFNFPPGAVDLASNAQFPTATYGPGVYCVTGAVTVGAGGITLTGVGAHIFRMSGALDTVAGSVVTVTGSSSVCDIWWTPIGATTLGANSTFAGTVIDAAGVTIGSTVIWNGRALAFGGTVSTATDTITASGCPNPTKANLTLTKTVVNDNGGTKVVSDFPLFVSGLPVTSGIATTTLAPGTYVASETSDPGYAAGSWTGDCASDGSVVLAAGDTKACALTNDDIATSGGGGGNRRNGQSAPIVAASTTVDSVPAASASSTALAFSTTSPSTVIPKLPNTGIGPDSSDLSYALVVITALLGSAMALFVARRKVFVPVDAAE